MTPSALNSPSKPVILLGCECGHMGKTAFLGPWALNDIVIWMVWPQWQIGLTDWHSSWGLGKGPESHRARAWLNHISCCEVNEMSTTRETKRPHRGAERSTAAGKRGKRSRHFTQSSSSVEQHIMWRCFYFGGWGQALRMFTLISWTSTLRLV